MYVFFNAYIILEENQILNKTNIFVILFLFSKKVIFPKKKFCPALIVEHNFLKFHTEICSSST